MSIVVRCPNPACAAFLKVEDELLGKHVQCPSCKAVMKVPGPAAVQETAIAPLTPARQTVPPARSEEAVAPVPLLPPLPLVGEEEAMTPAPLLPPLPLAPLEDAITSAPLPLAPERESITPASPGPSSASSLCPACLVALPAGAVLCVGCGYDFRIGRRLSTNREDDDNADQPRRKGQQRQQLRQIDLGLRFHYAKVICSLVSILLEIAAILMEALFGESVGRVGAGLAGLVSLVAPVLGITGSALCCWAPAKSGARPLIIASLALDAAALGLTIFAGILAVLFISGVLGLGAIIAAVVLNLFASLGGLTALVLFLLFLRRLAHYLEAPPLADEAMDTIIHLAKLVGGLLLAAFLVGGLAVKFQGGAVVLLSFVWIGMIVGMAKLLLRILNLIDAMRELVRTRLQSP